MNLDAAIRVVDQHGQLATLERRVREEHPVDRPHLAEHDDRVRDCLTEACAFAWADLRMLGAPQFDHRKGKPDIHVPPDLWVEAKAVHQSRASRAQMERMRRGHVVYGPVAPPDKNRREAILLSLADAKKKFARQGAGRWVAFFNLTTVDVDQLADRERVLGRYASWLGQLERQDPAVSIVFCAEYDWEHPLRDPFAPVRA